MIDPIKNIDAKSLKSHLLQDEDNNQTKQRRFEINIQTPSKLTIQIPAAIDSDEIICKHREIKEEESPSKLQYLKNYLGLAEKPGNFKEFKESQITTELHLSNDSFIDRNQLNEVIQAKKEDSILLREEDEEGQESENKGGIIQFEDSTYGHSEIRKHEEENVSLIKKFQIMSPGQDVKIFKSIILEKEDNHDLSDPDPSSLPPQNLLLPRSSSSSSINLLPPSPPERLSLYSNEVRKSIRMQKKKYGCSTILVKRDASIFINGDVKGSGFGSNGSNFRIEGFADADGGDVMTTNKKMMRELKNIEKHINFRRKLENFLILFNDKPKQGINYLIDSQMLKDPENYEEIASLLLTTEGISKLTLGQFFGSPDLYNQAVLKSYTSLFNFEAQPIDIALRSFLSEFILPGESQQIERILSIFSDKFILDNPLFPNEGKGGLIRMFGREEEERKEEEEKEEGGGGKVKEGKRKEEDGGRKEKKKEVDMAMDVFLLCYSIIMLNVDAHSGKMVGKRMKRTEFVERTRKVCTKITEEILSGIYSRILEKEIKTEIDYVEPILRKPTDLDKIVRSLKTGVNFLKYGRKGKPKNRLVWVDELEENIFWNDPVDKTKAPRFMPISELINIFTGIDGTPVLKKNHLPPEFDHLTFSLVSLKRSLDLKANDSLTRGFWLTYFKQKLIEKRETENLLTEEMRKKIAEDKDRITEIWKIDILPNWEYHWDYQARKPRNLTEFRKRKVLKNDRSKSNALSKFLGCFKTKPKKKGKSDLLQESLFEQEANADHELVKICKNRSLLLAILWKRGIPPLIRKTLWPIVIGNRLEMNETLYSILLKQVRNFSNDSDRYDKNILYSLSIMKKDLETIFIPESLNQISIKNSLDNLLKSFIFYRPDVGYVKGMSDLSLTLLIFLEEYDAFSCLMNLTHSHHFLPFLRFDMREIEWRVQFFNKYFEIELPHLFDHFKALDLSTEVFLVNWFLTLFSGLLNHEIVPRIWDCFLLDGEVYGFKTSLGILKYYEVELRLSTFDEAIIILKRLPAETIEEKLFALIEEINIPYYEYEKYLENQKMAFINAQIHQALLFN